MGFRDMDFKKKLDKVFEGQLRVWWISQVPGKPFTKLVKSVGNAVLLLDTLAEYDLFQLEQNIKPDFANVGGLEIFEDGEWVAWEQHGFEDPRDFLDYLAENGMLEGQI